MKMMKRVVVEVDLTVADAAASSRSRRDAETSSSGRRQCKERVRRLLVCVASVSSDDNARQSASVLSADQSV